jgi:rhodanese-related sulfurtransferase
MTHALVECWRSCFANLTENTVLIGEDEHNIGWMALFSNELNLPGTLMKTAHDLVAAAKATVKEITPDQAEQAIRDADVLLDVREDQEYASGHIPGAVHMSRGMLEFKLSANPALTSRDNAIVLYCKTGGRAALAARALAEMGYLNVQSIAGGIDAWQSAGKPVVKPQLPNFE